MARTPRRTSSSSDRNMRKVKRRRTGAADRFPFSGNPFCGFSCRRRGRLSRRWIKKKFRQTSSWSLDGAPLAFAPLPLFSLSQLWNMVTHKLTRQPHAFTDLYKKALRKVKEDHPAIIKAEHINGPILLTSGTDDLVWPSASMNEKIVERLKRRDFPILLNIYISKMPAIISGLHTFRHPSGKAENSLWGKN